jgi:hypothetical protein
VVLIKSSQTIIGFERPSSAVTRPNLRYGLETIRRLDAAGSVDVFCAPAESTLIPEKKVEITKMAIIRDLFRVLIMLGCSEW